MKSVSSIYLVMRHNYETSNDYPVKAFRNEVAAERFKAEMRASNPSASFYCVEVEVE